jgi:hypothetical protein
VIGSSANATVPVLFGRQSDQDLLLEIFRLGQVPISGRSRSAVWCSGIIAEVSTGGSRYAVLDWRHPFHGAIRSVLRELNSGDGAQPALKTSPKSDFRFPPDRPLGHRSATTFPALLHFARANDPISFPELRRRVTGATPQQLRGVIHLLQTSGIVFQSSGDYSMADIVPESYRSLILQFGDFLAAQDPRLDRDCVVAPRRVAAFVRNPDGAPSLFGTDLRLRNFMALAREGAMHDSELKRLTGADQVKGEGRDDAPFGRSAVVRTWCTANGKASELDPAFPAAFALRRLLVRLEQRYALPPHVALGVPPKRPQLREWRGDRDALFGGAIATGILMTIGVLGWTFEALCVAHCTGYDRVVVKKALKRLETAGIVQGERERRSGFNVRIVRIAPSCTGHEELEALLRSCVDAWPDISQRVHLNLARLPIRTREHLRRRGVNVDMQSSGQPVASVPVQRDVRSDHVRRYIELSIRLGREPSSNELMHLESNLYRSIRKEWRSFSSFRHDAGLQSVMSGTTRAPNEALRQRCIATYCRISDRLGFLPNTSDLNREDAWLSELIRVQWSSFSYFCKDLGIVPRRAHRFSGDTPASRREDCLLEYRALTGSLGYPPSSWELRRHTCGLYKRIKTLWSSFAAFSDDVGVGPRVGKDT